MGFARLVIKVFRWRHTSGIVPFPFESDLREPVAKWLHDGGFDVRMELSILGRRADLVGSRGATVTAIEMKIDRWAEALRQAIAYELAADRVGSRCLWPQHPAHIASVGPSKPKGWDSSLSMTAGASAVPSSPHRLRDFCRSCGRRSSRFGVPRHHSRNSPGELRILGDGRTTERQREERPRAALKCSRRFRVRRQQVPSAWSSLPDWERIWRGKAMSFLQGKPCSHDSKPRSCY